MCGVAGYCGPAFGADNAQALLRDMTGALRHRGPDDGGLYIGEAAGLGHRRLSVVGISDGHQPMVSADGHVHISYNGEIFNYVELRDAMMQRGRIFKTSSDTEVILHLYEELGPDCVSLLNGDFAFAIWDERRKRMMLARDRMGVRPLFHSWQNGTLYFASEVKALLEVPGLVARIDPVALDQIFTLWAPIAPRTAFLGISQLPPAHIMLIEGGEAASRPYWNLEFPDANDPGDDRSEAALAEELRALLDDATRIRLRADVPVGSYLSGGIDSSVIAAMAAKKVPQGLRTFSVTFTDADYDESVYQSQMVEMLGTTHTSVQFRASDTADLFPEVVSGTEQPILRTAPSPLYRLADHVREQGIKVVLTGEGADEILAGYDLFAEARVRRFCARQPRSRIRPHLFRKLYPYLPALQQQTPEYLAAFFGAGLDAADEPLFSHRPRLRSTAAAKMFFSDDLRATLGGYDAAEELASTLPAAFVRWHPLHQAQYIETTQLLPGYILSSQGDRMAMAHGVETRFPFLDPRLVEFSARIPPRFKLRGLSGKHLLKIAARGLVPDAIVKRPKQPYRAPESVSFARKGGYVAERLSAAALADAGLFNPRSSGKLVEKCLNKQAAGFRDNAAFVGVLSTQLWVDRFAGKQPPFQKTRRS
ncbi:asparagine synthase (glutamine-hydrolyzing) [Aminobacter sp. AP02]|uniref:asparagine synthase (glutamine-hydrolyzing) n=1 Tax=Aminobacter sp. AP02 TaxID=2135737 RepID=UPI000D6BF545|nr:asparagine synthase (glutamine-hydrolyzing) [Aminobacter sp. AP02]PWK76995.1 asparagine synthase (glutamine-hydrolysing) [Aminobacter sp. AP02]